MARTLDLLGKTFGRLTVVAFVPGRRCSYWECRCTCGATVIRQGHRLNKGQHKSCGCHNKERLAAQGTHNHCRRGAVSPTWSSWKAMLDRCAPTHKSRAYYFDKGIRVCKRWLVYANFLSDMGERPHGTSLDRIHNGRGYFKSNCQWSTKSAQQLNKTTTRRYTYQGESKTLTEWARDPRCAVKYCTLHKRVAKGVPFLQALKTEVYT